MVTTFSPQLIAQAVILGLLVGGVYALMSSGLTLVFGIMEIVNVAQGALLLVAAYMTYVLWTYVHIDPLLSVVVTLPIMFLFGLFLYRVVLSRLKYEFGAYSVLVTFAVALVLEGIVGYFFGGDFVTARPDYIRGSLSIGEYYLPYSRLIACGYAIATLIALYLLLTRSTLGRAIRATIQNRHAAQLVGVDVERVTAITFAVGIATAGVGGALLAVLTSFYPASHYLWTGQLLSIIVLGGMGSLPGAVIGALIMGCAESLAAVSISLSWSPIVYYVLLFFTLLFRPQGLLGMKTRRGI